MFPSASSAGLATGWRFSAILTATRSCSELLAPACVETVTGPEVAVSGTRAMTNSLVLTTTEPSASPKRTCGRWRSRGFRPEPTMRTSPPGSAAVGSSALICGCPLTFFFPTDRFAEPIVLDYFRIAKWSRSCITAKAYSPAPRSSTTIPVPSGSFSKRRMGNGLVMSNARKSISPTNMLCQLSGAPSKVSNWPAVSSITTMPGSFLPERTRNSRSGGNANGGYQRQQCKEDRETHADRQCAAESKPNQGGGERRPCTRTGLQQASAEESTYDPSPSRGGSAFRIQRSCFSGFGVVHSGSGKQLYQNLPVGCER